MSDDDVECDATLPVPRPRDVTEKSALLPRLHSAFRRRGRRRRRFFRARGSLFSGLN